MASARVFVVAIAVVMTVTACGGASQEGEPASGSGQDYPIVTEEEVAHTAEGHPVPPDSYSAEPSASCERLSYKSTAGPGYLVAPPQPGLTAKALDERLVEVTWSFHSLPADCLPLQVQLGIVATDGGTPTTKFVTVKGVTGSAQLRYPDFLPPPNVALGTSYSRGSITFQDGTTRSGVVFQSRTARVLISR
jgi:hypothetical protein